MSDEFVENMEEYFGVRMDMDGLRIGNEHSGDSENKRTDLTLMMELSFNIFVHTQVTNGFSINVIKCEFITKFL
ncbi:Hypothetical predicted protein [Octopus vulgaris]|uniref:Uncharacterized protein n=1 Tax=Octopus vulgaris TaxID=6645 RepID=A0AA36ARS2_OCTVU|nr:Hypothetical predicted protein [Octopus vulgaris]